MTGKKSEMKPEQYEAHKARVAERQRNAAAASNEIDLVDIAIVGDEQQREACRLDLERYLWTYFRVWFTGPFGVQQKRYIHMCEDIILAGGTHAQAMSRGWGKTRITGGGSLWAGSYGHRKFNLIIGATDDLAMKFLTHIKGQANLNDLLLADFPEIFFPIRKLQGVPNSCARQTFMGKSTGIEWTKSSIAFPAIPGSLGSGYRIDTAGLTGAIRGQSFAGPGGIDVRPDLIFLDDPQTKESARSFTQTQDRIDLIDEDIMGLGGPDKTMAVLMPCTIIRRGDLADQFLDRKKRPYWRGLKSGVFDKLPDNLALWNQYNELRGEAVAQDKGLEPGNDFYRQHREAMDFGCTSNWPEMFDPNTEVSAIQRAMNKYFEVGRRAFMAEYMNDPEQVNLSELYKLDPLDVRKRLNRLPRGRIPLGYEKLTCMIDVQQRLLWYAVVAWKDDFTGSVIDYGWCPDQNRRLFTLDDLSNTLQREAKTLDTDVDSTTWWGLNKLGETILDRQWMREDEVTLKISKGLIDINWNESESAVARFCRVSRWKGVMLPSRGRPLIPGKRRISQWAPKDGERFPRPAERAECEWMITATKHHRLQECYFHPNHWITRINKALTIPVHASGSISLYGEKPDEHQMLAEHVTSMYSETVTKDEVEGVVWKMRPGIVRKDLLDCLVGAAVAASIEGIQLGTEQLVAAASITKKRRIVVPDHMRVSN